MADYMLSLEEFDTTTKIFNIETMYFVFYYFDRVQTSVRIHIFF